MKAWRLKYRSEAAQSGPVYLSVMGANWAGASERAVGVALLRVGEGVVLHLVVPGLHVERGRPIPGDVSENDCVVRRGRFPPPPQSAARRARTTSLARINVEPLGPTVA